MGYIEEVYQKIAEYEKQNEEEPTRIYIPKTVLNEMMLEFEGEMKAKVAEDGWKALGDPPRFDGKKVIRSGNEIKVERNAEDL